MTAVSFGVLVFDAHGRLLMAHATGRRYWDIPKGAAEPGETPREAALRELREETGLVLAPARLTEIGLRRYYAGKALHLFRAAVSSVEWDIDRCVCSSFFPHPRTGLPTPEVDRFRWATPAEALALAARSMSAVLRQLPGFAVQQPDGAL
jgi:8-oxo-dGTP pyrophosphatase MutT (NUDIX family)